MGSTRKPQELNTGSLLPASLADAELDHVERMVQYMCRAQGTAATRGIDGEYWKKRLRAVEQTYDLVTTQRQRVARLFELLERSEHDAQGGYQACGVVALRSVLAS
jgi:ferritin